MNAKRTQPEPETDRVGVLGRLILPLGPLACYGVAAYEDASTQPNSRPWEHLPDLIKISARLRSALGG